MFKYAIIDTAILEGHRHFGLMHTDLAESLFTGRTQDLLDSVSPYLVKISHFENFMSWFVSTGHYKTGAILFDSMNPSFFDLKHHFGKFLYTKTDDGKSAFFRFYDPRVLPDFLRDSDNIQIVNIFGTINSFTLFGEDERLIEFSLDGDKLIEVRKDFDMKKYLNKNTSNIS